MATQPLSNYQEIIKSVREESIKEMTFLLSDAQKTCKSCKITKPSSELLIAVMQGLMEFRKVIEAEYFVQLEASLQKDIKVAENVSGGGLTAEN